MYRQINEFQLSKNNFIQINEKYVDCYNKGLCKQKPNYHLTDNTIDILKHANQNNFENILVFEDDFILDEQIEDKNIIQDLDDFINHNEFNLYFLGCIPLLTSFTSKHNKVYYSTASHSIIYSKIGRDLIIQEYEKDPCTSIKFHDAWYNTFVPNKYMYFKPLCYQPVEMTENKKEWGWSILNYPIDYFKLDIEPIQGFKKLYSFLKLLKIIVVILAIVIITIVIYKNKKKICKLLNNKI